MINISQLLDEIKSSPYNEWDRRQIRANLKQALLTIGGRNLYYR